MTNKSVEDKEKEEFLNIFKMHVQSSKKLTYCIYVGFI